MVDSFYRDFEDEFRGSCSTIKSRLKVYLPFILPLKNIYPELQVVDLGCGRGEWLELMKDEGIEAYGVDLDAGMLQMCQDAGLQSSKAEAISFLKSLPDCSKAVISAFHLVEHISFEELKELVSESYRVLVPLGLLILETPNSENIKVGISNFYLDPTHMRPIPAPLLRFLATYYGFCRSTILRLQESPELVGGKSIKLIDVINGVSPDYSLIAQKSSTDQSDYLFETLFKNDLGLTLEKLANKYDSYRDVEADNFREIIIEIKARFSQYTVQSELVLKQSELTLKQSELALKQSELALRESETTSKECELAFNQAEAMRNSLSWKITWPLRVISNLFLSFWHMLRGRK